jgi:hypothetical protein
MRGHWCGCTRAGNVREGTRARRWRQMDANVAIKATPRHLIGRGGGTKKSRSAACSLTYGRRYGTRDRTGKHAQERYEGVLLMYLDGVSVVGNCVCDVGIGGGHVWLEIWSAACSARTHNHPCPTITSPYPLSMPSIIDFDRDYVSVCPGASSVDMERAWHVEIAKRQRVAAGSGASAAAVHRRNEW